VDKNEKGRLKALSYAMKKRAPEISQPVKKPRPYALRYPLPASEIADGELIQSGVDTLQIKADLDKISVKGAFIRNEKTRRGNGTFQRCNRRFTGSTTRCDGCRITSFVSQSMHSIQQSLAMMRSPVGVRSVVRTGLCMSPTVYTTLNSTWYRCLVSH
jgi:hypothetical protein